jgi:N-acetylglutamate synthase/N-acetylornithine aminotransferase
LLRTNGRGVTAPKGFKVAAAKAGLRRSGTKADCALVLADADAVRLPAGAARAAARACTPARPPLCFCSRVG